MSKTTTITIDDKVKEVAKKKALDSKIKGGLSGYIQYLIIKDNKSKF